MSFASLESPEILRLARSGVMCLVATVSGYHNTGYHACEFSKVDMLAVGASWKRGGYKAGGP